MAGNVRRQVDGKPEALTGLSSASLMVSGFGLRIARWVEAWQLMWQRHWGSMGKEVVSDQVVGLLRAAVAQARPNKFAGEL